MNEPLQGVGTLTREQADGCRATIRRDPKPTRRWRESIFAASLNTIQFLESELERLRAYVECQPCKCCYLGDGDVMTCARCRALGKEKS